MQLIRSKELVRERSPRARRIPGQRSRRPRPEALETRTVPTLTLLVGPPLRPMACLPRIALAPVRTPNPAAPRGDCHPA